MFAGGMSMSGTALDNWAQMECPLQKAKNFSRIVGCSTENVSLMVNCLKDQSAHHIYLAFEKFYVSWTRSDFLVELKHYSTNRSAEKSNWIISWMITISVTDERYRSFCTGGWNRGLWIYVQWSVTNWNYRLWSSTRLAVDHGNSQWWGTLFCIT